MNKSDKKNNIPRFERNFLESEQNIFYIGDGSFGGKANGLISARDLICDKLNSNEYPDIEISLPRMIVLRTGIFDYFIKSNNLFDIALSDETDIIIANEFLKADLPAEILGDLRSLVEKIKIPLAVRSSSMLEDAKSAPFAGVYETKMIPNNQPSIDIRFQKLIESIKFVYASTYFKASKDYFRSSSRSIKDEKMAVIIQEVIGETHNIRHYPHISGVARSYNFYPTGKSKPEQGVVNLALGLGKTIVDGGISWSYSPAHPQTPLPFKDVKDIIKSTQNTFWAVNMNPIVNFDPTKETEYLYLGNIEEAEYDNTIKYLASTYNSQSDKIVLGTGGDGPRIINFSPLLHLNEFGFNNFIIRLLKVCEESFNNPVEIEFAATFPRNQNKMKFGFLQVRPMTVSDEFIELDDLEMFSENVLVASNKVMGNGLIENIYDIVYVNPNRFDKKVTQQIAKEIDSLNRKLVNENKNYLLIGFGRWGSCDPWLGIPVDWGQISGAKVIVESTLFGINVELSQGSHFFHNLASFNVSYFSINFDGKFRIDWDWLSMQNIIEESEFVKHVRLENSLLIKTDGRTGKGVILKCIPSEKMK